VFDHLSSVCHTTPATYARQTSGGRLFSYWQTAKKSSPLFMMSEVFWAFATLEIVKTKTAMIKVFM
jgi:hypothetical protein